MLHFRPMIWHMTSQTYEWQSNPYNYSINFSAENDVTIHQEYKISKKNIKFPLTYIHNEWNSKFDTYKELSFCSRDGMCVDVICDIFRTFEIVTIISRIFHRNLNHTFVKRERNLYIVTMHKDRIWFRGSDVRF